MNGDIWINGDSNLKAENIKRGVNIFGVTGTHDGFPTPKPDGDGKLILPIFENGAFVNGGITGIGLLRAYCSSTSAYKNGTGGNLRSGSEAWVTSHYPSIGATIKTSGSFFQSYTSQAGMCAWLLYLKIPVVKDAKRYYTAFNAESVDHPYPCDSDASPTKDNKLCKLAMLGNKFDNGEWSKPLSTSSRRTYMNIYEELSMIDFANIGIDTSVGNQWVENFCIFTKGWWVKMNSGATKNWYAGDAAISKIWMTVYMD